MWYPATVTTDPTSEPVSLDEAKRQCRVFYDDDNEELNRLISAARDHVEHYCSTRIATATVEAKCDRFADFCVFPEAPVQSVSSIVYTDTDGNQQTLPTSVYELRNDDLSASIALKYGQSWPATQPNSRITVTAVVGYEKVPPAVKHAMLLFIADAFEQRENAAAEDWSVLDTLLCNFRR